MFIDEIEQEKTAVKNEVSDTITISALLRQRYQLCPLAVSASLQDSPRQVRPPWNQDRAQARSPERTTLPPPADGGGANLQNRPDSAVPRGVRAQRLYGEAAAQHLPAIKHCTIP
jgi:hypothetical protein